MNNPRTKKNLLYASLVIGVILILVGAYLSLTPGATQSGKVAVKVYLVPTDAALKIDGKAAKAGTAYLDPGKHTVTAARDGFASASTGYDFTAGQTDAAIDIALIPQTNAARVYAHDHANLYQEREGREAARDATFGKNFAGKNPIVKQLPYKNFLYTIGYRLDPTDPTGNSIVIEIDSPTGYRNGAVEKIRSFGFDPTDFKIIFRDYQDPFSS
ncbi:MAG TPA: hypothetical protein VMT30_08690 [Candidatus Saccharimonadia bacterium]|nr:hypothetical protein [Candidatus Saccharimonadia bacterium]